MLVMFMMSTAAMNMIMGTENTSMMNIAIMAMMSMNTRNMVTRSMAMMGMNIRNMATRSTSTVRTWSISVSISITTTSTTIKSLTTFIEHKAPAPKKKVKKTHNLSLVSSVGFTIEGLLDVALFNAFMSGLLQTKAADLYRTKGTVVVL